MAMSNSAPKYAPLDEKIKITVIQPSPTVPPVAAHRACARARGQKQNLPVIREVEVTRNELDEAFYTSDLACTHCKRFI
jgi:hypothetical protein